MEKPRIRDVLLPVVATLYLTACQGGYSRIAQVDPTVTSPDFATPTATLPSRESQTQPIPIDHYDLFTYESVAFAYADQDEEIAFTETLRAITSRTRNNQPNGYTFVQFGTVPGTGLPFGLLVSGQGIEGTGTINSNGEALIDPFTGVTPAQQAPQALGDFFGTEPVTTAEQFGQTYTEYLEK